MGSLNRSGTWSKDLGRCPPGSKDRGLACPPTRARAVIIGVIAYAFDLFMRQVEGWLVPWKGKA